MCQCSISMDHAEGLSQYQGPTAYVMLCPRLRFNRYGRRMLHSSLVAHMVIHVSQTSSCAVYGVHPVLLRHFCHPPKLNANSALCACAASAMTAVPLLRGQSLALRLRRDTWSLRRCHPASTLVPNRTSTLLGDREYSQPSPCLTRTRTRPSIVEQDDVG